VLLPFIEDRLIDGIKDSHVITRIAKVNSEVDLTLFSPPSIAAK
jgi:hypothetical protein